MVDEGAHCIGGGMGGDLEGTGGPWGLEPSLPLACYGPKYDCANLHRRTYFNV